MSHKQFLVIRTDRGNLEYANSLSQILDAPVVESEGHSNSQYLLTLCGREMMLDYPGQGRSRPLLVEYKTRGPARGRDPLIRSLGKAPGNVFDMTGGWCMDAVQIARAGFQVIAIEKCRLVYCMVQHALGKLDDQALASRISLYCDDSIARLQKTVESPDIIYLDPMYPHKSGSAASKKNISILRNLVATGQAHNSVADKKMLQAALDTATRRVVVKRPNSAPPILDGKVGEVRSKLVRFDIYKPVSA